MKVLISGVGIAGPALAYWLLRHGGFEVTLVESAPRVRSGGYIVDFWGAGYDIAEEMGLLPALSEKSYPIRELRMVDGEGRRVGGVPVRAIRRAVRGRWLSIPRADLAAAIFRSIADRVEVLFGESIALLTEGAAEVEVHFTRSSRRTCSSSCSPSRRRTPPPILKSRRRFFVAVFPMPAGNARRSSPGSTRRRPSISTG